MSEDKTAAASSEVSDEQIKAQAEQLVDALAKALNTDGVLRQIRLGPIAKAKLLWFIEGAVAGYSMCEDCDGEGVIGEEYGGSDFQPPERDLCQSCNGSGRWKLASAAPAAVVPADSTEQALGLYVAQADEIRELLDQHAPHTSGNLVVRVSQLFGSRIDADKLQRALAELLGAVEQWDRAEGFSERADARDRLKSARHAAAEMVSGAAEVQRHAANEWADMATNGLQWLKNVRDGISTADEAIASLERDLAHCRAIQDAALAGGVDAPQGQSEADGVDSTPAPQTFEPNYTPGIPSDYAVPSAAAAAFPKLGVRENGNG